MAEQITSVKICNLALSKLKHKRITKIDNPSSEEEILCNLYYPIVRDEVSRSHEWNFAKWRQSLGKISSTDANYLLTDFADWEYQYSLPTNPYCLRVLSIPDHEDATYEIVDRYLLCNLSEDVEISYIRQVLDPTRFDALFIQAFAYKLAAELAIPLTSSVPSHDQMIALYELALRRARGINDLESTQLEPAEDGWVTGGDYRSA